MPHSCLRRATGGDTIRAAVTLAFALFAPLSLLGEDSGRIYLYAQRPTVARSWLPISCDSVVVAKVKQGKYFALKLRAGRHVLATDNGAPLIIDVEEDKDSFVRLDWEYRMDGPPIPVLSVVEHTKARKEMRYLSYIDTSKILAPSVPKTDPRDPKQPQFKRREEQ